MSTEAFTLFCHDVHGFTNHFLCLCHLCDSFVLTRLSARCLPSSCLDTASIRSRLQLPPGFHDTREAGNCSGSRACGLFSQSSRLFSAHDDMCPVGSGSVREMCLQAMRKYEGPAASLICFSLFPPQLESALILTIYSGYAWARSN